MLVWRGRIRSSIALSAVTVVLLGRFAGVSHAQSAPWNETLPPPPGANATVGTAQAPLPPDSATGDASVTVPASTSLGPPSAVAPTAEITGATVPAPALTHLPGRLTLTDQVDPEPYSQTPDPSVSNVFAFPTATLLLKGDGTLRVGSMLGWISGRYGVTRRLDVGVGVPFALVGVALDARVALVQQRAWALSLWAMVQVPLHPGGPGLARAFFGFNWSGSGPWWTAGALLSITGERASFHLGLHGNQRVSLGGMWGLATVSAEVRLFDGMKAIGQAVLFGELVNESASTLERRSLLSNSQPRLMPYALLGVRVYSRRSAVDLGVLATVGDQSLLAYGPVSVWPVLSGGYWF